MGSGLRSISLAERTKTVAIDEIAIEDTEPGVALDVVLAVEPRNDGLEESRLLGLGARAFELKFREMLARWGSAQKP